MYNYDYEDELLHYGVKGMKWGVIRARRQAMNKAYRQSISDDKARSKSGERVTIRQANINAKKAARAAGKQFKMEQKNNSTDTKSNTQTEKKGLSDKQKKAIKIGAAAAGTALAVYGGYKLSKAIKDKDFQIRQKQAEAYIDRYKSKMLDLTINKDGTATFRRYSNSSSGVYKNISADSARSLYEQARESDRQASMKAYNMVNRKVGLGEATKNVVGEYKKDIGRKMRYNRIARANYRMAHPR